MSLSDDTRTRSKADTTVDELVMLKLKITSDDNSALMKECTPASLSQMQDGIIASIKDRIGRTASARISFHKGSIIILVSIAATIYITKYMIKYISSDVEALVRKILRRVSRLDVDTTMKRIKDATSIIADILSIALKLFSWFGGGAGFSPMPPDSDPTGWTPI